MRVDQNPPLLLSGKQLTWRLSVLEYGSPVFHRDLPGYLSKGLERLQKRAMKIIYSELSYAKTLELSGLLTLYDKREAIIRQMVVRRSTVC